MPTTMKLDTPEFKKLFTPQLHKLSKLFQECNYELRIAGGAVRDLMMGIQPADVDFASTATPTQMKELFESHGIRMLHKKGEEHGTITCRIDEAENFEITTLRIDVLCDGRRAEVKYTTDWELDANRRDLTVNSLFLGLDGTVYDYFGGIEDVQKRQIRFVGDAQTRIQEDFLRILRYFRFFGRISVTEEHEKETLGAIARNKHGLKGISAERIWVEFKKIVIGRMAPAVLRSMFGPECELQEYVGLPKAVNLDRFQKVSIYNFLKIKLSYYLVYEKYGSRLESMTSVALLCELEDHIDAFHTRTKLSNDEKFLGFFIVRERVEAEKNRNDLNWWKDLCVEAEGRPGRGTEPDKTRQKILQLMISVLAEEELIQQIENYVCPKFQVTGVDLMEAKVPRGPKMKATLGYLFDIWKNSKYTMTKEEILKHALDSGIPDKDVGFDPVYGKPKHKRQRTE
ncbi:hypothetical protein WR25_07133 [Diploscapter pachys]|uniref:Poly A polymerase head domain-containing protein n=1 Tax=Diploscapter pachys TaxID=2018661 RepID=A0A2A2JF71_9BILA|nr:hypothetical protein WR25_07133 [Diploscapter pachys]